MLSLRAAYTLNSIQWAGQHNIRAREWCQDIILAEHTHAELWYCWDCCGGNDSKKHTWYMDWTLFYLEQDPSLHESKWTVLIYTCCWSVLFNLAQQHLGVSTVMLFKIMPYMSCTECAQWVTWSWPAALQAEILQLYCWLTGKCWAAGG